MASVIPQCRYYSLLRDFLLITPRHRNLRNLKIIFFAGVVFVLEWFGTSFQNFLLSVSGSERILSVNFSQCQCQCCWLLPTPLSCWYCCGCFYYTVQNACWGLKKLQERKNGESATPRINESATPRIGDTGSRQLLVSVICGVADSLYRWLGESLSKYFLKNSPYHLYA